MSQILLEEEQTIRTLTTCTRKTTNCDNTTVLFCDVSLTDDVVYCLLTMHVAFLKNVIYYLTRRQLLRICVDCCYHATALTCVKEIVQMLFAAETLMPVCQRGKTENIHNSPSRLIRQNWMAAYLDYTLRMKMLFHGWPVMVHDTHTRRRIRQLTKINFTKLWFHSRWLVRLSLHKLISLRRENIILKHLLFIIIRTTKSNVDSLNSEQTQFMTTASQLK